MMKIKVTLAFISLIMLYSCSEDLAEHSAVRRIVNETDFDVRVEVFGDESNKLTYNIPSLDSINIEGTCWTGVENYCSLGWNGDLAFGIIFFDEIKAQNFDFPSDSNVKFINADPIGGFGYIRTNEDGIRVYTYRITQEDYENTEPIGG